MVFSVVSFAQVKKILGTVLGTEREALAGVSVNIKGTKSGTATDNNGKFSLFANKGDVLIFTFYGFDEREVLVEDNLNINVQLEIKTNTLQQVVVIGYGTQRRKDITGAIASVNAEDIRNLPLTNTQQALQGKVAGVDVINNSNSPGAEPQVRIRGSRSFSAGNTPLYVVDGIPMVNNVDLGNGAISAGGISDINPSDIASLEILKDASATAIYGSRGANGVVIITTKRGKIGVPVIAYNSYYGVSDRLGRVDVMNGAQFGEYKRESRRATGAYPAGLDAAADKKLFEPVELESIALGRSTDYQSLLLKQGFQTSHEVSVSGGTPSTKYLISMGYFKDKGIVPTQDYWRYNLKVNLDQNIGKSIKIGTSALLSSSIRDGQNLNPIGGALEENPLGNPYDSSHNLIFLPTSDGLRSNPLAEIVPGALVDRRRRLRFFGSIYGELNITEGLKYRINYGPDLTQNNAGYFQGTLTNARRNGSTRAGQSNLFTNAYTVENILTYNRTFQKDHTINLTGLYSVQKQRSESSTIDVEGVPVENQSYYNLGAANINRGFTSNLSEFTIASYMARINYVLKGKYLLTLTGRADGSSRFAESHKWGYFPSIAAGWSIGEESFIKKIQAITNLKIRVSYGLVGNTDIAPYLTEGSLSRTTYAFGTTSAFGYGPGEIPNPNLKWENTATTNIGLDFGFFNDRIAGNIEVYRQIVTDLLLRKFLPISNGFNSILQNVGSTENRGLEIHLSTLNIKKKYFSWNTDISFSINRQKIRSLFSGQKDDIGNGWFIGHPIQVYYDYKKIGIWQTQDSALAKSYNQNVGEIRIEDVSGPNGKPDGKIDAYDRLILGTNEPKWTAGITNKLNYKAIDLSLFVYLRQGGMIRSRFHDNYNHLAGRYNNLNINYWTPSNPTNDYPRPNQNQENPIYGSTLTYFDGSFIKIRNITLGYTFSNQLISKIKASSLRIYVAAQQPLILAPYRQKYKGIDPEGITEVNGNTPSSRLVLVGLNVTF
ncbi:MAG: TonB-dependent receptor [Ginsengibacter sp.]